MLASTSDPAYARALDAGHAAAASGQWLTAGARFGDAMASAARYDDGTPQVATAVALTNLGQALARAGRWDAARDALRRAADTRDALLAAGAVEPTVSARGWSDLAALLAAVGPTDEARDALDRATALGEDTLCPEVRAALRETRALLALDAPAPIAPPDDVVDVYAADELAHTTLALAELDEIATFEDVEVPSAAAFARHAHVDEADEDEDDGPDLSALLALASGPSEPEAEPVELEGGDSLRDALDAAVQWSDATDVAHTPADPATAADEPQDDDADDLDAEPILLTPGVDLSAPHGAASGAPRVGGAHGQRLAAIDEILQLTANEQPPKSGGLWGFVKRLTGR